jgi:hypothetical protein
MIRKVIRAASVLLSALAIPAAVLAAPLPANADSSGETICEVNGGHYCTNTTSFSSFTSVFEDSHSARTIDVVFQSPNNTNYLLEFNGSFLQSQCIAANNNEDRVVIKPCYGSIGVDWTLKIVDGSDEWINNAATRDAGKNIYLAGSNCQGCQFKLLPSGISGALYKFFLNGNG